MRKQAPLYCAVLLALSHFGGPIQAASAPAHNLTFSSTSLPFPPAVVSSTSELPLTIKNQTDSTLSLRFGDSELSDFRVTGGNCGCRLEPKKICSIRVRFSPRSPTKVTELLPILYGSTGCGGEHVVLFPLTGEGKESTPAILPASLHFPPREVFTRGPAQTVGIYNNSAEPIVIQRLVPSGDFLLDPAGAPRTLAAQEAAYLSLRFEPKKSGRRLGRLSIWIGKEASPRVVSLSGWGICPDWWCGGMRDLSNFGLALLLSILYLAGMITARWHRVALPTRDLLKAQIDSLRVEIALLPNPVQGNPPPKEQLEQLLNAAGQFLNSGGRSKLTDFLFWSRGQESAGWAYVHDVEAQLAAWRDDAFVRVRLETLETNLRQTGQPACVSLADLIHTELTHSSGTVDVPRRKALLAEALATHYQNVDRGYADLMGWQNKASWLVVSGLVLVLALVGAFPEQAILFLMGALGGLLSRLSRTLTGKDVPTDYGASWTTLFLSPVSGALGGWVGILLASFLVKLGILGNMFDVHWDPPISTLALGIAVAFGFSERLLSSVLDKVAAKAEADENSATTSSASKPSLKITVGPAMPDGVVEAVYPAFKLEATGAVGRVSWHLARASAGLPGGLEIKESEIVGTPTKPEIDYKFTLEARDREATDSRTFTITIKPKPQ